MVKDNNVHKLYNVMTLDDVIHSMFEGFALWFEATVQSPATLTACIH
jgi:hypothetical protein